MPCTLVEHALILQHTLEEYAFSHTPAYACRVRKNTLACACRMCKNTSAYPCRVHYNTRTYAREARKNTVKCARKIYLICQKVRPHNNRAVEVLKKHFTSFLPAWRIVTSGKFVVKQRNPSGTLKLENFEASQDNLKPSQSTLC